MGLKSGHNVIWTCDGLTVRDIHSIHRLIFKNAHDTCRIDVDVSNILNILAKGKSYQKGINEVAFYLKILAHNGNFFVTAILDGVVRPDCKRASIKNKAT